jgi:type III secretory pathway component EscT
MDFFTIILLSSARAFGFMLSLPLGDAVSTLPRLAVSVVLGYALSASSDIPQGASTLLAGVEFAIGYILGYPFRFVTDLADLMGELLDAARGQTLASIIDPLNGPASSDLAAVMRLAACALALYCGALVSGCHALHLSYDMVPAAALPNIELLSSRTLVVASSVVSALAGSFITFVGAFIGVDLVAALCSRVCSHLSFGTLSHLAKFLILVIIAVALLVWWGQEVALFFSREMITAQPL